MADMKLDEAKLRASIREVAEEVQARLSERIRKSVEEVGQVARALRDTPDSTLKLFETAAVAQVAEVDYGSEQRWVRARVETSASSIPFSEGNREVVIPAGKYRALFFLVKVADASKSCDDCGVQTDNLVTKGNHHGGSKTVCRDRDACNRRPQR